MIGIYNEKFGDNEFGFDKLKYFRSLFFFQPWVVGMVYEERTIIDTLVLKTLYINGLLAWPVKSYEFVHWICDLLGSKGKITK